MNKDKRPKEQRIQFRRESKPKIGHPHEKDVYGIKIILLFIKAIFIFSITAIYHLFFLESFLEIFTKSLIFSTIKNTYSLLEKYFLYEDSLHIKYNNIILNEVSNINKTKNNLEIYKEVNLNSSFRKILYEMLLDKDILCLYYSLINRHEIREEKIKNVSLVAMKINIGLTKNNFYEVGNVLEKYLNSERIRKNKIENIKIVYNKNNKRKNKMIKYINYIRNINTIKKLIICVQILCHNNNWIKFQFSNIIKRINEIYNKKVFEINNYSGVPYINGNNPVIYSYYVIFFNQPSFNKYKLRLFIVIEMILIIYKLIYFNERIKEKIKIVLDKKIYFYEVKKTFNLKDNKKNDDKNKGTEDNTKNKRKNKIIRKISHISNNISIIIKLLIKIILCIQILSHNNIRVKFQFSSIKLKIKGTGVKDIFSSKPNYNTKYYPNEITINGNKTDIIKSSYYLEQQINTVELIWNNTIDNCEHIFCLCTDITEIDLSNFDTSECTSMYCMFCGCSSLTLLNLSNFDTSHVNTFQSMFHDCPLLISLNLSTFNTLTATSMFNIFYDCKSLEYINMQNFDESKLTNYSNMFYNVPNNVVICINEDKTKNKIFPQIRDKSCYNIDCTNNWKSGQNKLNDSGACIHNCQNRAQYKYEYNEKCYENCSNGYILDENNNKIDKCKCELEKCLTCRQEALNKNLCTECNTDYYKMENETSDITDYFNCYKEIKGYYLDKNNLVFKKCYYTCEECEIKGDNVTHNCLKCNENYTNMININNYTNCYKNCIYYYYFDNENNYYCTSNLSCPNEYPKLLEDKKECINDNTMYTMYMKTSEIINELYTTTILFKEEISTINKQTIEKIETIETFKTEQTESFINLIFNFDDILKDILRKFEKNETKKEMTKEEEINYYNEIIKTIESIFTDINFNTSKIDNGDDEIIKIEKIMITLTTTQNQKDELNNNNNMTIIDLGECENNIRKFYQISNDTKIYMQKMDIIQEGMKIPKIEYYVYCKLNGTNLIRLNLSICENNKISLSIPIEITENIDELNTSSKYYNDICYSVTSDSGTDILLEDRQKEFLDENKTICQEDCDFTEYDSILKKAKCSCQVKESSFSFSDMNINRTKLLKNFQDIKNYINMNILKCYQNLFDNKNILKNIGFILILMIKIFHIISNFIFHLIQLRTIQKKIKDIIFAINNLELINPDRESSKKKIKTEEKEYEIKNRIDNKNKNYIKINVQSINFNNNNFNINNENNLDIKSYYSAGDIISNNKNDEDKKNKIIEKIKNIMKYNIDEINILKYDLALLYDKRTYWEYYISLLKSKHIFIFSFFNNYDYNARIIKMDLFFIGFTINYTVNALFFNDDTMHKIYENKGSFNLEYQIPIIIYSSLISMILNKPLKILALSNDAIISFKQNAKTNDIKNRGKRLSYKLRIKFIFYFIISTLFLLFFWYYISMFGIVYKNTQLHLLKDTLISFGISMIIPFGIYLLPGLFRIPSLSNPKKKGEYLYNFSKIIQML